MSHSLLLYQEAGKQEKKVWIWNSGNQEKKREKLLTTKDAKDLNGDGVQDITLKVFIYCLSWKLGSVSLGISNILKFVFQDINRLLQGFDFLPRHIITQGTPGSKTHILDNSHPGPGKKFSQKIIQNRSRFSNISLDVRTVHPARYFLKKRLIILSSDIITAEWSALLDLSRLIWNFQGDWPHSFWPHSFNPIRSLP